MTFWSASCGFDLIDGGYYYLTYRFPADVADTHTSFHLLAGAVFSAVGHDIVSFRLLSWGLVWLAAAGFAVGLVHQQRRVAPIAWSLPECALCGVALVLTSFAAYTFVPVALTYNSLNVVCLFATLGLWLDGIARLTAPTKRAKWIARTEMTAGFLFVLFQLFIKPPTALFMGAAGLGLLTFTPLIPRAEKIRLAAFAALGGLLGAIGFAFVAGGLDAIASRLQTFWSIGNNSAFTDELLTRLARNLGELFNLLRLDLTVPLATLTVGGLLAFAYRSRPVLARRVALVVLALVAAAVGFIAWRGGIWRAAHANFAEAAVTRLHLGFALLGLAIWGLARLVPSPRPTTLTPDNSTLTHGWPRHLTLVLCLFLLAPLAGAFGTTNPLYMNAAFHAPCWTAVGIIALFAAARRLQAPAIIAVAFTSIALGTLAQLHHGLIAHPYASRVPLTAHTRPTTIGEGHSQLKLEPALGKFIDATRATLKAHGFQPGDDIFAFFNLPGLVYAVGGRSPVVPWYFGRIYAGNPVEESYMQAAGPERRARAWVITQADAPRFIDHYARGGLNFPAGYEQIGELTNPLTAMSIKLWKPRSAAATAAP